MALHYLLIFGLFAIEIAVFLVLIIPFPLRFRRSILLWISKSTLIAQSQFVLKLTFFIVTLLFIDATYGTYKIQREIVDRSDQRIASSHAAKKFYNQRNMYLTGFTLFLSLILNRTYILILDLIKSESQLESTKREIGIQNQLGEKGKNLKKENQVLKKELEEQKLKSQETENLLEQIELQKSEYLELLEKVNEYEKKMRSPA